VTFKLFRENVMQQITKTSFLLISILLLLANCTNKKSNERLSSEQRNYECTSIAKMVEADKEPKIDSQSVKVDFNSSPNNQGPTVKHSYGKTDIFVEFWSNDINGASATGFVKGFLSREQWSGGLSRPEGLPESFEIALNPYEVSNTAKVEFLISCKR
jgi:hypothetical protein